ncbi:MAG: hypothetical protein AABM43_03130 [Actinomycetota bacterium]
MVTATRAPFVPNQIHAGHEHTRSRSLDRFRGRDLVDEPSRISDALVVEPDVEKSRNSDSNEDSQNWMNMLSGRKGDD